MKKIIISIFNLSISIFTFFVFIPLLWIIEPFWRFRFSESPEGRIGHLSADMDNYARDIRWKGMPPRTTHIFFAWNPANKQLLKMWKRHVNIVENYFLRRCSLIFIPILKNTRFHLNYPNHTDGLGLVSLTPPILCFTEEEEEHGRLSLEKMGITSNEWFVCFHSRDPLYLSARPNAAQNGYDPIPGDCSIESYIPAMQWIAEQGGFAIRVGYLSEKELPDLGPRVIDYSSHHRTDFMDIYLAAKCRFFMGSVGGFGSVPLLFGTPTSMAHRAPYLGYSSSSKLTVIPKFLRRKGEDRFLTFYECHLLGLFEVTDVTRKVLRDKKYYDNLDLEWIENSSEDILDLCYDMMDIVEHRELPQALEAKRLQSVYKIYQGEPFSSTIGPRFAMKYKNFIIGKE